MPVNRGQMEIMGLAIIVILITIGLLFALIWMAKTPPAQLQRAKESVLAANFLNTMLGTTVTDCNDRTTSELLQDCALTGGINKCGEATSCERANEAIRQMLDATLKKWGLKYNLAITGMPVLEQMSFGTEPCKGEREEKTTPLPVEIGLRASLTLQICR
jgi:hypothetical protein